jgi:hypothetical protein
VSCADAGEGSHFDGGWEFKNRARIFTVNEAPGSSTLTKMLHTKSVEFPCSVAAFVDKSEPHTGLRFSVRLCVGLSRLARGSLAWRRQLPVGLCIRLHPETHDAHWPYRSELQRTGASCCVTLGCDIGPPKSSPTDQRHHSFVSRNGAYLSWLVAAREEIRFSELSLFLYPGCDHFRRFDSNFLPVLNWALLSPHTNLNV